MTTSPSFSWRESFLIWITGKQLFPKLQNYKYGEFVYYLRLLHGGIQVNSTYLGWNKQRSLLVFVPVECAVKKVLFTAAIQSARLKNFIMNVCTYQSQFPVFNTVPTVAKRASKPSSANDPKSEKALNLDRICVCGSSPKGNERLLKCHGEDCKNGNFCHLHCLDYKRMPNKSQTTWMCSNCKVTTYS